MLVAWDLVQKWRETTLACSGFGYCFGSLCKDRIANGMGLSYLGKWVLLFVFFKKKGYCFLYTA